MQVIHLVLDVLKRQLECCLFWLYYAKKTSRWHSNFYYRLIEAINFAIYRLMFSKIKVRSAL